MSKNRSVNLVIAVAMLAVSLAAQADTPWFGGVSLGAVHNAIDFKDWNDGSIQTGSVDQQELGKLFFVGYRVRPRTWVEVAWVDLGRTTFNGVSLGGSVWDIGNVRGETKTQGLGVSLAGAKPLSQHISVYAKAGLFAWDTKVVYDPTIASQGTANTGRLQVNNDGIRLTYGLGTEVQMRKDWYLRAAWDHYDVDYARIGSKTDAFAVNLFSAGFVWNVL